MGESASLRYIDDLICSRVRNLPSGSYVTRYHLTDAQFSTVALLSSSGTLLERVAYDPYGEARHQWPGDLIASFGPPLLQTRRGRDQERKNQAR